MRFLYLAFIFIFILTFSSLRYNSGGGRDLASEETSTSCLEAMQSILKQSDISKNVINHGADEEFEKDLLNSIYDVNEFLTRVGKPKGYRIDLYKELKHSNNFNGPKNVFGVITGAQKYSIINQASKFHGIHPKYSKAIILHEYGHEVFAQAILKYVSNNEVVTVYKGRNQIFRNMQLADDLKKQVFVLSENNLSEEELLSHPFFKKFQEASRELQEGFQVYDQEIKDLIIPYDELFADVIAIMATDDPRVMYRATSAGGRNGNSRDFSAQYSLRNWNEKRPHLLFNPVRSYIYKKYLTSPSYKGHKDIVIEIILTAIGRELDYYAEFGFSRTPYEMNASLINQIDLVSKEIKKP